MPKGILKNKVRAPVDEPDLDPESPDSEPSEDEGLYGGPSSESEPEPVEDRYPVSDIRRWMKPGSIWEYLDKSESTAKENKEVESSNNSSGSSSESEPGDGGEEEAAAKKKKEDEEDRKSVEAEKKRVAKQAAAKKKAEDEERRQAAEKKKAEDEAERQKVERRKAKEAEKKKAEEEERKRREKEENKASAEKKRRAELQKEAEEEEEKRIAKEAEARKQAKKEKKQKDKEAAAEEEATPKAKEAKQEKKDKVKKRKDDKSPSANHVKEPKKNDKDDKDDTADTGEKGKKVKKEKKDTKEGKKEKKEKQDMKDEKENAGKEKKRARAETGDEEPKKPKTGSGEQEAKPSESDTKKRETEGEAGGEKKRVRTEESAIVVAEAPKKLEGAEAALKINSASHPAAYAAFNRLADNKSRCPAKLLAAVSNKDSCVPSVCVSVIHARKRERNSLWTTLCAVVTPSSSSFGTPSAWRKGPGRRSSGASGRASGLRTGMEPARPRNWSSESLLRACVLACANLLALAVRHIPDPELPDDPDEKLFYTIINLDMSNFTEVKRVTKLEMEGKIDQDGLKEFVKAWLLSLECGGRVGWWHSGPVRSASGRRHQGHAWDFRASGCHGHCNSSC